MDSIYPEHERAIFGPYFNGREAVHADPVRVYRLLSLHCGGDFNGTLARSRSDDLVPRNQAHETLLAAAVQAFELTPFDPATGEGLREDQIVGVVNNFTAYLGSKKKPTDSSPTSPVPTGLPGLSDEIDRLMKPLSDSGSISPASAPPTHGA